MQYVPLNPVCIVLIIPGHSREVPRRGCGTPLIREYNDDSSHLTYINDINNMKFQLVFGLFNFLHIRFCRLQKASEITPWKKCYSLLRWPCPLQDVLNRRLLFKTNRQQCFSKETITHHFFVSGIGQKKTVDAFGKICGGAENVVKTKPSKHS